MSRQISASNKLAAPLVCGGQTPAKASAINATTTTIPTAIGKRRSSTSGAEEIERLYKAARDENELLEFKNYELQFKIMELEQKQAMLLNHANHDPINDIRRIGSISTGNLAISLIDNNRLANNELEKENSKSKQEACQNDRIGSKSKSALNLQIVIPTNECPTITIPIKQEDDEIVKVSYETVMRETI